MRAWRVHEHGAPADVLVLEDGLAEPVPGPGQVRVAVEACALNFADSLLCDGTYQEHPPLPFTPGLEVCGRVEAAGEGAGALLGARVVALTSLPHGGLATHALAAEHDVFAIPEALGAAEAAALPVAYQTGWFALHHRARLRPGETVLVHAGAGGVGSAAIELAVAAGARVVATAGGPEKVARCRALGAHVAVDYRAEDFVAAVREFTDGRGADVIYDSVGGDTFDRSRRCIAWEGRLLVIGFAGGRPADAPTNHVLVKNYSVVGVHWGGYRTRDPELVQRCHAELVALWEQGRIHPLVSAERPLADAADALAALTGRSTTGKVVLRP
ncbi:MAG: NADPH:quinone oxidoreductase family protein [Acidimicrobiales bacterium]|nr:NADPH:quinone oxidoreductase family protein [Acidimicrobiales bacterium]MCB9371445.1 NADPH:quinone oxidoreductase family protein [Microthrixaceae bacterium]